MTDAPADQADPQPTPTRQGAGSTRGDGHRARRLEQEATVTQQPAHTNPAEIETTRPTSSATIWIHFHAPTDRAHVEAYLQDSGTFVLTIRRDDTPGPVQGFLLASRHRGQIEATLIDALAAIRAIPVPSRFHINEDGGGGATVTCHNCGSDATHWDPGTGWSCSNCGASDADE